MMTSGLRMARLAPALALVAACSGDVETRQARETAPPGADFIAAVPQTAPVTEPIEVSDAELACLAQAAYFEARGEGAKGMSAVVHVVINRMRSPRYPDNACAVVRQGGPSAPCQFSWYCDGRSDEPRNARAYARAERIARAAVEGRDPDPTHGATMFHSTAVRPFWAAKGRRTASIGNHLFYTLN